MCRLKRLWAILPIALLIASLAAPSAQLTAQRTAENTARLAQADIEGMAALMPSDSTFFFALRTDDNYIELLDSLIQKVYDTLPRLTLPSFSLKQLLDLAAQQALGGDFQTKVRPWLGDTIAFAIGSLEKLLDADPRNDAQTETLLAARIVNRAAFEATLESLADPRSYSKSRSAEFTDYEDLQQPLLVRVSETLVLAGTKASVNSALSRAAKLNANPQFKQTVGALPESAYNIFAYANLSELGQFAAFLPREQRDLVRSFAVPFAIGATILDGRSLVLDVAIQNTELVGDPSLGKPVNPDFARWMPADTVLSVHLRDLSAYYRALLSALRLILSGQAELLGFELALQQFEEALRSSLGLDLNQDILSWLTGDFAIFIAHTPQERSLLELGIDPSLRLPFVGYDLGLVTEATDPRKAARLIAVLGSALQASLRDVPAVTVTPGERRVTLTINLPNLTTPIQVVIGVNDAVFYIATGAAAAHIESGAEGLLAAAGYREAQRYLLPRSNQVLYMGSDAINLLAEVLALQESERLGRSSALELFRDTRFRAQFFAKLLSSSSISSAARNGFQTARAVLTLPE
ncbi:MAG: DUF3352 domain-containing protein [Chloroflexi bacterium]|nr:DUF3352 domain-containing protein [Chloroflexota bacterium]